MGADHPFGWSTMHFWDTHILLLINHHDFLNNVLDGRLRDPRTTMIVQFMDLANAEGFYPSASNDLIQSINNFLGHEQITRN